MNFNFASFSRLSRCVYCFTIGFVTVVDLVAGFWLQLFARARELFGSQLAIPKGSACSDGAPKSLAKGERARARPSVEIVGIIFTVANR